MNPFVNYISIFILFILYLIIKTNVHKQKLKRLFNQPLPQNIISIIEKKLPPYRNMNANFKAHLQGNIQIFLYDKIFEGCGGLKITKEIKITIACQACLLLLNRKTKCYPKLKTILVYPTAYKDNQKRILGTSEVDSSVRLGESWKSGEVVLSWDSVRAGISNYQDGHNVTFHEFAHQLDQESGDANGAPILESKSAYSTWAKVFTKEFYKLIQTSQKGKKSVIYEYGTTNPAEFFAVASEAFFEKPRQLKNKHSALYNELCSYYKVSPIDWL